MANVALNGLGSLYKGTYASKILLEPMFTSDDIMRNYTIYPSVKYKQNITMAPSLRGITAVHSGCGTTNSCDPAGFTLTQKVLHAHNVSVKQTQCWEEFHDEVIVESYRNGINMPDLTGTQLAEVIINRVRAGVANDMVRNMWFGEATISAGSPDCSYQSMGNGLFHHLSAGTAFQAGTSANMTPVTGALTLAAATASYATVGGLISNADVISLLDNVFNTAPAELQQVPASEKRMFVTPNVYNAWYNCLTAVAVAGAVDYGHSEAQVGKERLFYKGIEVVPMYEWDVALALSATGAGIDLSAAFTQAGATTTTQTTNGVVYTAKANLFIGTDVARPENELKMFYDEVSENMYVRAGFTMGFQYGWNTLVNGATLIG
ncbi:MAG: hypothetical protein Unbinned8210contig1002_15 [Prokaryotic dsDNA virus sp.]|nr:MAG: hypothetical protein Unbinned8210contig1002_15 [Prokaryotic dsDNA virus sp.]|tara:strand:+ start:16339 stop:17469 length:1131 start_codon:yes stop_codon:yes gene_type:complete